MIFRLICWLRGKHKWRKLRKGERSYIPASQVSFIAGDHKACDTCGIVMAIKRRKRPITTDGINLKLGDILPGEPVSSSLQPPNKLSSPPAKSPLDEF